jgi:tagatose-1,6-bisphosphate aldolase
MRSQMTDEERELRVRLDAAVRRILTNISRCPAVDEMHLVNLAAAASAADATNQALLDAVWCVDQLAQLRDATEDAALLVATSRIGFDVVREVLTVVTAAIDCHRAA